MNQSTEYFYNGISAVKNQRMIPFQSLSKAQVGTMRLSIAVVLSITSTAVQEVIRSIDERDTSENPGCKQKRPIKI